MWLIRKFRRGRPDQAPAGPAESTDPTRPARDTGPTGTGQVRSGQGADRESGRDWVVGLGLAVSGLAAIVASFSTLTHLARLVGWGDLDWLLPVVIDSYAITATRVWLSRQTRSRKVRRFAMSNAVGAIALSIVGNAAYHAIAAGAWDPGEWWWLLVVTVSSIPPVAIGLISHLAVLRGRDAEFAAAEADRSGAARPVAGDPTPAAPEPDPDRRVESDRPVEPEPAPTPVEGDPASPDPAPIAPPRLAPLPPEPTPSLTLVGPAPVESDRTGRGGGALAGPADSIRATGQPDKNERLEKALRDSLLPQAREIYNAHYAATGRHMGADRLREALSIGTKRARALRDALLYLHATDPTPDPTAPAGQAGQAEVVLDPAREAV